MAMAQDMLAALELTEVAASSDPLPSPPRGRWRRTWSASRPCCWYRRDPTPPSALNAGGYVRHPRRKDDCDERDSTGAP